MLRIRDVYPGSDFFPSRIRIFFHPRSRIHIYEFNYFNPKSCFKLSEIWSGLFIPDPDPDFLPIPDPGVKRAPDPGSGSATLLEHVKFCKIFVLLIYIMSFSGVSEHQLTWRPGRHHLSPRHNILLPLHGRSPLTVRHRLPPVALTARRRPLAPLHVRREGGDGAATSPQRENNGGTAANCCRDSWSRRRRSASYLQFSHHILVRDGGVCVTKRKTRKKKPRWKQFIYLLTAFIRKCETWTNGAKFFPLNHREEACYIYMRMLYI